MTKPDGSTPRRLQRIPRSDPEDRSRLQRIPRSDPEDRSNDRPIHIPNARRTSWEYVVGRPSAFVQHPPLRFQFEDFQGDQVIVRLMKNSEDMLAWNVEIQSNECLSNYYSLYYWKRSSRYQEDCNRKNLLRSDLRWTDNMTDTRQEDAIDDYNPIMDMLEEIGIDIGETF